MPNRDPGSQKPSKNQRNIDCSGTGTVVIGVIFTIPVPEQTKTA